VDIAEEKEEVKRYAEEQGLTFTILLDEDSAVARAYLVRGIPSTYFIDGEGMLRIRHTGPLNDNLISQGIEQLLP
jgi:peroxiredoxin